MKELIGAAVLLVGLYGGTKAIKEIHDEFTCDLRKVNGQHF